MSQFKKNLESLPAIDAVEQLELLEGKGNNIVSIIENKPGKSGSVAVYYSLKLNYGQLNYESAIAGLALFAEHVIPAAKEPGLHPNIDLLFNVIENNRQLTIQVVNR